MREIIRLGEKGMLWFLSKVEWPTSPDDSGRSVARLSTSRLIDSFVHSRVLRLAFGGFINWRVGG